MTTWVGKVGKEWIGKSTVWGFVLFIFLFELIFLDVFVPTGFVFPTFSVVYRQLTSYSNSDKKKRHPV
jgi:hypothetical protein